jgi:hypothetical protein
MTVRQVRKELKAIQAQRVRKEPQVRKEPLAQLDRKEMTELMGLLDPRERRALRVRKAFKERPARRDQQDHKATTEPQARRVHKAILAIPVPKER